MRVGRSNLFQYYVICGTITKMRLLNNRYKNSELGLVFGGLNMIKKNLLFACFCLLVVSAQARTILMIDKATGKPVLLNDEDPAHMQKLQQMQGRGVSGQMQQKHDQPMTSKVEPAKIEPAAPVAPTPDPIVPTDGQEIKGCFRIQGSDKVPEYRIYFNGRQTMNNREGFFSFPVEEHEINNFSMVICRGFNQNFDQKNTIKNVSMITCKDYQYFTYRNNGFEGGSWKRSDVQFNKENFVIPQNCVVVLIDPGYVDHVSEWNVSLDKRFIKLPMIVLKETTELKHESAKSLLASLDAKIFHESIAEVKKIAPNNPKIHMSLAK